MAGQERSRRSSRVRKGPRDSDSEGDDKDFMEQAVGAEEVGPARETDRLAKIQEKNRKAQQKCATSCLPQAMQSQPACRPGAFQSTWSDVLSARKEQAGC